MYAKRCFIAVSAIVLILASISTRLIPSASAVGNQYYVSPSGNDTNAGISAAAPFKTIQKAVDLAQPGDVINLASGVYLQDMVTKRDGTVASPITIQGPADAVVKGGGSARVFLVNHNNIVLQGFTMDGLFGDPNSISGYREKLLFAIGTHVRDGVNGLRVLHMTFLNGGGECIRLRYFAHDNEVGFNTISNCGVHQFRFGAAGQDGEGVYLGTAPEQLNDGKNPTNDRDQSTRNWIHDNVIDTEGAECVDLKEAAYGNLIENNRCTGTKQATSGGFSVRGNYNTYRLNESYSNLGVGIRLGGDTATDGVNNDVYGNNLHDNPVGGVKFERSPQGKVCGNTMSHNSGGDSAGTYRSSFAPAAPCVDSTPTVIGRTPTVAPSSTPTAAPTNTPTAAPTRAPTATPTAVPTNSPTPRPILTATPLPTRTPAPTANSTACSRRYSVNGNIPAYVDAELYTEVSGSFVQVNDASRSGGAYMKIPGNGMHSDPNTWLSYNVTVSGGGTFSVWILGYGPSDSSDSFYVRSDASNKVQAILSQKGWGWHKMDGTVMLGDGNHVIQVMDREDGASIDKMLLVKDSRLLPSGMGGSSLVPLCQ